MTVAGFTVEWLPKGFRPDYRRDPIVQVRRQYITGDWFAVWIGQRIRIGRKR